MNQDAIGQHHDEQFGDKSLVQRGLKLGEEAGEVQGAIIRHDEQRDGRGWEPEIEAELGQLLIVIAATCHKLDLSMAQIATAAEEAFLSRRWNNIDPVAALTEEDNE